MRKNTFFTHLGLALLITSFAATSFAGPIITVSPDTAGPINCSDSTTFVVHYNPNDYSGDLYGFSILLANGAGDYVTFDDSNGSSDVTLLDWPGGFFGSESDNPYELAVSGAVIGGSALPADTGADLFSITFHGAATGMGELNILDVVLKNANNQNIAPDLWVNPMATIEVDCTAPDAPVMNPELTYTAGTENTVSWGAVADAVEYNVVCDNGASSGWIAGTSFTFTGLTHGDTYGYSVQARDDVGNEGPFSDMVYSTQDAVTPESAVGALNAAYGTWTFDVPWTASDDMSGVQYVELRFRVDGGPWENYQLTHTVSPISFTGTEDGVYDFYTVATDNAGNAEVGGEADAVQTLVDTTAPDAPVMDGEPEFTQGTQNTVSWSAVGDAVEYNAVCSSGASSGWTTGLEWTFTGLADGSNYEYSVQARDALGNVGVFSATVSSTQDDTAPESSVVAPPSGDMLVQVFDIEVASSDATSGVSLLRLFYRLDAGTWTQFGGGFTSSPITFTAPSDGQFSFYTIAVDEVGNVELAPAVADLVLRVDTMGPTGTFAINGGDDYTTSPDVTLNCDFTDANVVVDMRFSDDGVTWSGWETYAGTFDWTLPGGDGEQTVFAEFRDGTGQVSGISDTIILDTTAPLAVTVPWNTGAVPGHETVTLNWVEDDAAGDLAVVEIWAALWDDVYDGQGNSVYPEYDDDNWAPSTTPVPPTVEQLAADGDFFLVAEVAAGELTYIHTGDSPWARGAFSYYFFARDMAGNYSGPQANWPRRSVNYILGDFTGDGTIAIGGDVTPFAGAYGANEGHPAYQNIFDIGPVGGGVPTTDNDIDFEDLMILSGNFNAQGGTKSAVGDPETPILTWYQVDELNWVLGLTKPCNSLKGIRLVHALPENATISYTGGDMLNGSIPHVLANDNDNGLDIGFAVLGRNQVLPGSGEIFRITTSEPLDLSAASILARDAANEEIECEVTAEPLVVLPSVYKLADNYPNPFNPETTIKFSLPEAQAVRLEIFDIKGHRVQVLVNDTMEAGNHSVVWNGRDKNGRSVASGAYFYRIQAGPLNDTRRMLLVK